MNTLERPKHSNATKQTSVLLVEDSLADARYVQEMLPPSSYSLLHVNSLREAHESTKSGRFDVVLLDLSLPDAQGLETFLAMLEFAPTIPIVILTGLNNQDIAIQAIKLGAQDYVQKHDLNVDILTRAIRYAIERNRIEGLIRDSAAKALAAEAHLKLALKASQTGVWSWEVEEDKVTTDDQVLAMFGLRDGSQLKRLQDFLNRVHIDDRQQVSNAIEAALDEQEEYDIEFRVIWNDASEHYLAAAGKVIYNASGTEVSMLGICRDVTKQKIEQTNAKRLLILEKHEDFVATLTHDLKSPLIGTERVLTLFLTGAIGALDGEQQNALRLLQESNSGMLALLRNLLEVYRHDAGGPTLEFTEVDVAALSNTCIQQLSASAESAGVRLTSHFAESDHTIVADSISLRRVLMNLLSNAMKFTGSRGNVTVSGHMLGNTYTLEVKDTGAGMPQEDLEALFQKYSQGQLGKKYSDGTGLGLYLCRQLTEAHGGTITCTSTQGIGTTFTVSLPSRV
jgi:PAS domain S-box-containing protein